MNHVLNVLHPGIKEGKAYAIAYDLLTRAQVLLVRTSCLTRSLSWLKPTTVLLAPHPYRGPLAKHEHKDLERGSRVGLVSKDLPSADRDHPSHG